MKVRPLLIIPILFLSIAIGIVLFFCNTVNDNFSLDNDRQSIVENKLLFITNGSFIIYDPYSEREVRTEKFILPGEDFYVQSADYNNRTKEIVYLASNCDDMGSAECTNILYKINVLDNANPVVIPVYVDENLYLHDWTIDSANNLIVANYWPENPLGDPNKQTIKKINIETGQLIFFKEYERREDIDISGYPKIILSPDQRSIHQLENNSVDRSCYNDVLRLRKIDGEGSLSERTIFTGSCIERYTLSPNINYVAFYEKNLYIYDLVNDNLIEVDQFQKPANYSLFWSGDGKKLLFYVGKEIYYYDLELSSSKVLGGIGSVIGWSPLNNFIVCDGLYENVSIYNIQERKIVPLSIADVIRYFVY